MAFDNTTNKTRPSTKCEPQSTPKCEGDSTSYHHSNQQRNHQNKEAFLKTTHHWSQHELENARLLESDMGMDGIDGDLAVLLNDLSMAKPSQPAYFMPYCA